MSSRRRSMSNSPGHGRNRSPNRRYRQNREIRPITWDSIKLPEIKSCSAALTNAVNEKSSDFLASFYKENEIKISSGMKIATSFNEINFPECIDKKLKDNLWSPLPLQAQVLPIILEGNNIYVSSKSGTGKALSFILPVICHTLEQTKGNKHQETGYDPGKGPISLVLVPTREIAEYIEHCTCYFASGSDLLISAIYGGGGSRSLQRDSINKNPSIIIATPGRLMDFLESDFLDLKTCSMLVLYETDRMLDMGFESKIKTISTQIRPDRKTAVFTTRVNQDVDYVAKRLCKTPIEMTMNYKKIIGNQKVRQIIEVLTPGRKFEKLCEILKRIEKLQVMIFVETIRGADYLKEKLRDKNYYVGTIHVEKTSKEREQTFEKLRSGSLDIVVSTDLASRGININNVNCIINYDYPSLTEDYKNRLVRICRSESKVSFYSFFHTRNGKLAKELIKVLEEAREKIPESLKKISKEGYMGGNRRRYRYSYSSSRSRSRTPDRKNKEKSGSYRSDSSASRSASTGSSSSKSRKSFSDRSLSNSRSASKVSQHSSKSNESHGKSPASSRSSVSSSRRRGSSIESSKKEEVMEKKRSRSSSTNEPVAKIARSVLDDSKMDQTKDEVNLVECLATKQPNTVEDSILESYQKRDFEEEKNGLTESKKPSDEGSCSPQRSNSGSEPTNQIPRKSARSSSSASSRSSGSNSRTSVISDERRKRHSPDNGKRRNYRGGIRSHSSSSSNRSSRSRSKSSPSPPQQHKTSRRRYSRSRSYSRRRRSPSYCGRPRGNVTTKRYSRRRSPSYRKRSSVRKVYRRSPLRRPMLRDHSKSPRSLSRSISPPSHKRDQKQSANNNNKVAADQQTKNRQRKSLSVASNRSEKSSSSSSNSDSVAVSSKKKKKSKKNKKKSEKDAADDSSSSSEGEESKKSTKKKKAVKKKAAKKLKKSKKKKKKSKANSDDDDNVGSTKNDDGVDDKERKSKKSKKKSKKS